MADRRMFSRSVIESDLFMEMPITSQLLYFHLALRADDDGFVSRPRGIMRECGAKDDDMRTLVGRGYLIAFESGVVVVTHWKLHNTIKSDRYKPTVYLEEASRLTRSHRGVYELDPNWNQNGSKLEPEWNQNGSKLDTQNRLGKDSVDQDSIGENKASPAAQKTVRKKYGEYNNVLLSDDEIEKLRKEYPDAHERIERLSAYIASKGNKYKSHYATIRNWARRDGDQKPKKIEYEDPDEFFARM